jgi:flagellar hook-length control protein FliK
VSAEVPPPLRGRLPQPQPRVSHVAPTPAGAIETYHPALLKQLEGALARIGLHQVATAENFNEGQNLWQLEIPVRHGNAVEIVALTIEKETARNSPDTADEDAWSVNLSLDLPNLGSLQSRISMDKQGLSTTFWTRSRHNLSLIENRLPELRRNLELHGLEINQFKCIDGQQPTAHAAKADGSLIDYQI